MPDPVYFIPGMHQNFRTPNFLMVSVPLTPDGSGNALSSYIFPPQQQLYNRKVVAIEMFSGDDITVDPNNPGNIPLDAAGMKAANISFYTQRSGPPTPVDEFQQAGVWFDKLPATRLRAMNNFNAQITPTTSWGPGIFIIRPTEISWEKSSINFASNFAVGSNSSAVFGIHYLDPGDNGLWLYGIWKKPI